MAKFQLIYLIIMESNNYKNIDVNLSMQILIDLNYLLLCD